MKKLLLTFGLILVFFVLIVSIIFLQKNINNPNKRTLTKAFCNGSNYCEDYEITCENQKIKSISPTGFVIQNSNSWKDPRTPEEINKLCERNKI